MAAKYEIATVFVAVDKITGPLNKMAGSVDNFAMSANRSFRRVNRSVQGMEKSATSGLKGITAVALTGGAVLAKYGKAGIDFEQSLVTAGAKFPVAIRKGTKAFEELENVTRNIGENTEFQATQAAEAVDFLALASFNAEQSMAILPSIVDLATSANLDLATATDIASSALGAYNLKTDDTAQLTKNMDRIMDAMNKTSTITKSSVEDLSRAYKAAAPVASAAGVSIETLNAMVGALALGGTEGAEAGTSLRTVITRLQAPASKAASLLGQLGVQTQDSAGNMLDIVGIIGNLDKSLEGMGSAQKAGILKEIFGEEHLAKVQILMAAGEEQLGSYRKTIEEAGGSTKTLASIMRDTASADIKGLNSAVESLSISFFNLNQEGFRDSTQAATGWVRGLNTMVKANEELGKSMSQDVIKVGMGLAKVFGALTVAVIVLKIVSVSMAAGMLIFNTAALTVSATIKIFAAVIKTVSFVLGGAQKAMAFLNITMALNPVGLIIAGIIAFIAVGVLLVKNWEAISEFFGNMWVFLKDSAMLAIEGITAAFSTLVDIGTGVMGIWDKMRGVVSAPVEGEIKVKQTTRREGQVISPMQGITKSINESFGSSEVILRAEPGTTAEIIKQSGPAGLSVINSGGF